MRAPIQSMSTLCLRASLICFLVATSVATYIPVSSLTRCNHFSPKTPTPSKPPGLVRGFQIPARNTLTPIEDSSLAVCITCSSVSALQGPDIISGRFCSTPDSRIDSTFIYYITGFCLLKNQLFFRKLLLYWKLNCPMTCEYIYLHYFHI